MAFATGPFQAPDEENHFLRAFQLSQGKLLPIVARLGDGTVDAGGILPACLRDTSKPFQRMKFQPSEKVNGNEWMQGIRNSFHAIPERFEGFQNTAIYPPVSYLPQVLGIWLTRPFAVSPLVMMYVGRVFNLFSWGAMVFFSIRLMPVQKWVLVLVALAPMSVFLAASLSSDPLINAMAMLYAALIAKALLIDGDQVTVIEKAAIGLLCVGIGLAKIVYSPLIALVLLIPAPKLGGIRRKVVFCLIVIGCAAFTGVGWAYVIRGFIVTREWTNPPAQVSFIVHRPVAYLRVLLKTINDDWQVYRNQIVGVLGWLDTLLPPWIYMSYPPAVLLAAVTSDSGDRTGDRTPNIWQRVVLLLVCLLSVVLVETAVFVVWSPPGIPIVSSVQGRYFIPVVVPFFLVLVNRRVVLPEKWRTRIACSYCAIVLMSACYVVIERYYR